MLDFNVKIGLVPMRRNTTNRPEKTFLTWASAEERGHRFVDYIEKNFKSENVTFADSKTHGTYIWGEFSDLQAIEDRLLDGPYIHHFVEMRGDYRKEIKEFCKYFSNLKVDETIK